ncbi:MAG: rare lipoprotein [Alphaproteobacteria bacterium]|jgi:rare lipoprotein A|nr:rare lipoprotein [Alphaproteobacteria bacterium]
MGRGEHAGALAQIARAGVAIIVCLALANCANNVDPRYGVSASPRVVNAGDPVPKGGGTYRVGKPYVVAGRTYMPEENINYRAEGIASWYGDDFHGRLTANGEVYDMHSISAAHPTLPMPSYVRVTNLANQKSIVVRVNDRGPYAANRVIDLSVRAAKLLGFHDKGLGRVRVEYVARAPLEGSDDRQLVATLREGEAAPAPSAVRVAAAKPFLPEQKPAVAEYTERSPNLPEISAQASLRASERTPPALGRAEMNRAVRVEAMALPPANAGYRTPSGADIDKPMASPVSAFAPARYDAPAAFLSGRGLY